VAAFLAYALSDRATFEATDITPALADSMTAQPYGGGPGAFSPVEAADLLRRQLPPSGGITFDPPDAVYPRQFDRESRLPPGVDGRIVFTRGWSATGQGEAILIIKQVEDGSFRLTSGVWSDWPFLLLDEARQRNELRNLVVASLRDKEYDQLPEISSGVIYEAGNLDQPLPAPSIPDDLRDGWYLPDAQFQLIDDVPTTTVPPPDAYAFEDLLGCRIYDCFGPSVEVAGGTYMGGWGPNGVDEVILVYAAGEFPYTHEWYTIIYAPGGF
jgi:hypothetical protein